MKSIKFGFGVSRGDAAKTTRALLDLRAAGVPVWPRERDKQAMFGGPLFPIHGETEADTRYCFYIFQEYAPDKEGELVAKIFPDQAALLRAAEARAAKAEEVLYAVQWCQTDGYELTCPECDQTQKHRHAPDCRIGMILAPPPSAAPERKESE